MNAPGSSVPFQDRAGWSRTELLFLSTAVMLLSGILLPWSPAALDLLWILQLSLTLAVFLTCLMAQSSRQLDGFPLLAASGSLLSFLAVAGSMRTVVLRPETSGRLIGLTGRAIASLEPLLSLLTVFLLGFFLLYLIWLAGKRIHSAIEQYFFEILPFKKAGLETDRSLQILTVSQAQVLLDHIQKEVRFYASMEQIRKLLLAQITVNLFLVLTAWPLAWLSEWLQSAQAPGGHSPLESLAPALTGTALLAWIPAAVSAVSCAALLSKPSLALPRTDSRSQSAQTRKIQIQSSVSGQPEEIEILNPQSLSTPSIGPAAAEQLADFEPFRPSSPPAALADIRPLTLSCRSCDEYYRQMEDWISQPLFDQSIVLLISESVKDLPVAAAVHPALRLAQKNKNILLLDADGRNAVARVFSLEPSALAVPTPVAQLEHLWLQTVDLKKEWPPAVGTAGVDFFRCLVYAPQSLPLPPSVKIDRPVQVLFFTTLSADQVRQRLAGLAGIPCIYTILPLSAAVQQTD